MIRLAIYFGVAATCTLGGLLPQTGDEAVTVVSPRQAQQPANSQTNILVQASQATPSFDFQSQLHGVVRPSMSADLPSLVPGLITEVHVSEGQYVKKGTPLISLDDRVPRARLEAATVEANLSGALKRAQVELKMAESHLTRIRQVHSQQAGANFEVEAAEGARDQAAASVSQQEDVLKAAEATRKLAEAQLHQYAIVAPFDGLVTEIHRKSGAVDPSLVVISIANLQLLEVEMHVPSSLFGKIRSGNPVVLQASSPINGSINASVQSVSPIINSASESFRCLLQINNNDNRLPAGFTVLLQNGTSRNAGRLTEIK